MERNAIFETIYSTYIEKQKKFKDLVKSVQYHLNLKEYKKQGYSFDEYVKMKWNISKAQAYRYLISAKVLDQLEEFDIQPSYERLCRSLNSYAKTTLQLKLLWKTILNKIGTTPDNISCLFVAKVWKELCNDKRYSNICHYEENIIDRVEKTLNKYSKSIKHKQLNSKSNKINNSNNSTDNNSIVNIQNSINYSIKPENTYIQSNNNQIIQVVENNNSPFIYYQDINNNNNNSIQNTTTVSQQSSYQTVSYVSSPVSVKATYPSLSQSPLNNNVYIIYSNPTTVNTPNSSIISPVHTISCNNDKVIHNINTQCSIPNTSVTYVESSPSYLPSPIFENAPKPIQYIQTVEIIPNLQQNNIIHY
ncbi:hypothetical protein LY90DRAFT_671597 [Neocallimastix californiae]|uniref:Uncharacterized protein n=1 Tax=Neocallimastix californiae TaxID=1754190 RepID=A0A1Y2CC24_9FUNG|nr:hypothetical protein LY90DRAFT_671597 [Neocallimastix californiae]|eukprot:ORY44582.1 hypothetical protein LY90DRAFT_671597 [Neocallimastix californiae]